MVGSVVAESTFENGSDRLFVYKRDEALFAEALHHPGGLQVVPFPVHERVFDARSSTCYAGIARSEGGPSLHKKAHKRGAFRKTGQEPGFRH